MDSITNNTEKNIEVIKDHLSEYANKEIYKDPTYNKIFTLCETSLKNVLDEKRLNKKKDLRELGINFHYLYHILEKSNIEKKEASNFLLNEQAITFWQDGEINKSWEKFHDTFGSLYGLTDKDGLNLLKNILDPEKTNVIEAWRFGLFTYIRGNLMSFIHTVNDIHLIPSFGSRSEKLKRTRILNGITEKELLDYGSSFDTLSLMGTINKMKQTQGGNLYIEFLEDTIMADKIDELFPNQNVVMKDGLHCVDELYPEDTVKRRVKRRLNIIRMIMQESPISSFTERDNELKKKMEKNGEEQTLNPTKLQQYISSSSQSIMRLIQKQQAFYETLFLQSQTAPEQQVELTKAKSNENFIKTQFDNLALSKSKSKRKKVHGSLILNDPSSIISSPSLSSLVPTEGISFDKKLEKSKNFINTKFRDLDKKRMSVPKIDMSSINELRQSINDEETSSSMSSQEDNISIASIFKQLYKLETQLKQREESVSLREDKLRRDKEIFEREKSEFKLLKQQQIELISLWKNDLSDRMGKSKTNFENTTKNLTEKEKEKIIFIQRYWRKVLDHKNLIKQKVQFLKQITLSEEFSKQRKRLCAFKEVFSTERAYFQALSIVYNRYLMHFKEKNNQVISDKQCEFLFLGWTEIYNIHKQVLNDFESRLTHWPIKSTVGDLFIKYAPMFKMYDRFVKNYDNAQKILGELSENKAFIEYQKGIDEKFSSLNICGLSSLLIRPIQRLPRYILLINALLDLTPPSHIDFNDLTKALELVTEVTNRVNNNKHKFEILGDLISVESQILNIPKNIHLVEKSRKLIHSGNLVDIFEKKEKNHYFLFNNLLIVTTKKGKKYEWKTSHELGKLSVKEIPDTENVKNSFSLISETNGKKNIFGFSCSTQEDQQKWIEMIKFHISDKV